MDVITIAKSISLLIKPASGSCNVNCSYCFYKDLELSGDVPNKGIMSDSTMRKIIDNVFVDLNKGDLLEFAFQGGEPTLLGIDFYKNFIDYVETINKSNIELSYSLQTNGILIDENWCRFFKENNFLIGLSLDGPAHINDRYRLDYDGKGIYNQIMNAKNMLDKYCVEYNILSVLTNELARRPKEMWDFIRKEKIEYIQFIPCIDDINQRSNSEYTLTPENFAYFYKVVFGLWKESLYNGDYYSIGLIDKLISFLAGQAQGSCSIRGTCNPQYVVEADGSVYPCDFYVLEKYNSGNMNEDSIREIFYNEAMQEFLGDKKDISNYCRKCKYFSICNGGCKRLEKAVYLNDSETFCGYKNFLDNTIRDILYIAKTI